MNGVRPPDKWAHIGLMGLNRATSALLSVLLFSLLSSLPLLPRLNVLALFAFFLWTGMTKFSLLPVYSLLSEINRA